MNRMQDPAVVRWRAWKQAERAAAFAPVQCWSTAQAVADEADDCLLLAWPRTPDGAWCLLARAYEARLISEHNNASDGTVDEATSAAYRMKRSLRMLRSKEPGALASLREAIRLMTEQPLRDADNELTLRHLEVALAFLSRPRAIAN